MNEDEKVTLLSAAITGLFFAMVFTVPVGIVLSSKYMLNLSLSAIDYGIIFLFILYPLSVLFCLAEAPGFSLTDKFSYIFSYFKKPDVSSRGRRSPR